MQLNHLACLLNWKFLYPLDLLCPLYENTFIPDKHLAIDESVISFKGRVGFLQYLKGKPNPWGIKAFVLADSCTGYLVFLSFKTRPVRVSSENREGVRQT